MACLVCCLLFRASAEADMAYVYSGVGNLDSRDDFVSQLLITALDRTAPAYGPYSVRKILDQPRIRQIRDMENGTGMITFAILGTAHDVSARLRPIRIPIDKGVAGYRLLLIRQDRQPDFAVVKTLDDLKRFSFGQDFSWDDVDILRANGLAVQSGGDFEGLYQMLARKRFDAFPRGIYEAAPELHLRAPAYPELQIEKTLLLYYPLPIYFWFPRTPKGEEQAKRLEEGMWSMISDGSYDALLWKFSRPALEGLDLAHRRVLVLKNPLLPPQTPLKDSRLWASPAQLGLIAPRQDSAETVMKMPPPQENR